VSCLRDVKENTQLLTFAQQLGVETSAPFGGVFPFATRKSRGVWRVGSTRGSIFFWQTAPIPSRMTERPPRLSVETSKFALGSSSGRRLTMLCHLQFWRKECAGGRGAAPQ
jgi:hypothetical protein